MLRSRFLEPAMSAFLWLIFTVAAVILFISIQTTYSSRRGLVERRGDLEKGGQEIMAREGQWNDFEEGEEIMLKVGSDKEV